MAKKKFDEKELAPVLGRAFLICDVLKDAEPEDLVAIRAIAESLKESIDKMLGARRIHFTAEIMNNYSDARAGMILHWLRNYMEKHNLHNLVEDGKENNA